MRSFRTGRQWALFLGLALSVGLTGCDSGSSGNTSSAARDSAENGGDNVTETVEIVTLSGQVSEDNEQLDPVAGARIVVYSSTDPASTVASETVTDDDGHFVLVLDPNPLPDYFLMHVTADGYVTATQDLERATLGDQTALSFLLQRSDDSVVEVGDESDDETDDTDATPDEPLVTDVDDPLLHHLGDDFYLRAINSQFQAQSEGLVYEQGFSLNEAQLQSEKATMHLLVKGSEYRNPIFINDIQLGVILPGNPDGSYYELLVNIPMNFLQAENTLRIESVINPYDPFDYDDFEFSALVIKFE